MQPFMPQKLLPDVVTVPEAARYLGVGKKEIYRMIDFGELRAIRENGRVLIDPKSIYAIRDRAKVR